jgi:hypothetical protein
MSVQPRKEPHKSPTLIHGHEQRKSPNPQSSNPPAHHNLVPMIRRRYLHNQAHRKNHRPKRHRQPPSNLIRNRRCNQRSDQRSNRQHRHNKPRPHVREHILPSLRISLAKASQKVRHLQEARDLARIVAEAVIISLAIAQRLH